MLSNIRRVLWDSDLIASRCTLAFAEAAWAVMLLWIGDTFSRPTYQHMAEVMSEEYWAVLFIISAFIQIYIVIADKMHKVWAWHFAGWNFCLWGFTVVSMLMAVYPPPAAIGGEIALAITAFWIWLRPIINKHGVL